MANGTGLDAHHRATLEQIFNHPLSHNIQWHDVLSLLRSVATVKEGAHGRYTVTLGSEIKAFEEPRHHDIGEQQVIDLRRMLKNAGFEPNTAS